MKSEHMEVGHKNIVLIGMMGSGKSTIAHLLSEDAPFAFVDTDELIENATRKTVQELFSAMGESAFRILETEVLETVCRPGGRVIATGGGIVLKEENMSLLKDHGFVVYLKVNVDHLADRLAKETANRPLLSAFAENFDGLKEKLNKLMDERGGLYERYADLIVENSESTPKELVELILRSYNNSFGQ